MAHDTHTTAAHTFADACMAFVAAARTFRGVARTAGDDAATRADAVAWDMAARAAMRAVEYTTLAAAAAYDATGVATGVDVRDGRGNTRRRAPRTGAVAATTPGAGDAAGTALTGVAGATYAGRRRAS